MSNSFLLQAGRGSVVLKSFDHSRQHWGTFLAGFPWQYICTATHRGRVSGARSERSFDEFIYSIRGRLAQVVGLTGKVGFPIAYAAVRERRTSGLGLPGIANHWHVLFAVPEHVQQKAAGLAHRLWGFRNGDITIARYDAARHGAHYIAKLAGSSDFEVKFDGLRRLPYFGPRDLYRAQQSDPYVPGHSKHLTFGQTLVLRAADRIADTDTADFAIDLERSRGQHGRNGKRQKTC